jgi:hypothetical protein
MASGKAHGAIVAAIVSGSKKKPRTTPPPMDKALAQLRTAAKLSKADFTQLTQIVALATNKPVGTGPETLHQIRAFDEALQRQPASAHPLVLAVSSIANDSATTALEKATSTNGNKSKGQVSKFVDQVKVVAADVAGAILGAIAGAKKTKDVDVIVAAAVGGAIFASATVGSGQPFPNIDVDFTVE